VKGEMTSMDEEKQKYKRSRASSYVNTWTYSSDDLRPEVHLRLLLESLLQQGELQSVLPGAKRVSLQL